MSSSHQDHNVYEPGHRMNAGRMREYAREEVADAHLEQSAGSLVLEDDESSYPLGGSTDPSHQQQQHHPGGAHHHPHPQSRPHAIPVGSPSSPHHARASDPAVMLEGGQDSRDSMDQWNNTDPSILFSILEEAIPKAQQTTSKNAGLANGSLADQQQAREMVELAWDRVRRWMWAHPVFEERRAAAFFRGQNDATPLHLICKLHNPPDDIVQALVEAAPDTTAWTDTHGWLPLHHACANGASPEVIKLLIDAFPEGKLQQDNQKRTPLHFYSTRNNDNPANMALNAELLSDTGAAELADGGGMLPLHYACAYGTHPAVLQVIADAYPMSLQAQENHGRTPMHLAMVNAHRDASPGVIRFLLDQEVSRGTINSRDKDGYLPLHLMALGLKGYRADETEKRANVSECLQMYLAAEPFAAADFLTAIQDLPDWLQDTAVVSKHVRNILNEKIAQRFPTSILMLDGMFLVLLIVSFALTTRNHISLRFDPDNPDVENDTQGLLVLLFLGGTYFLVRELVQIASLMSLGSLSSWWKDPSNWLDMAVIVLVFYYGVLMTDSSLGIGNGTFRSGVTFTQGILWVAIIVFLKSTLVDFAVFVGGLFNVVQRLVAFLIAVGVILLAFAQMFYFVYVDTDMCDGHLQEGDVGYDLENSQCDFPHCSFQESLLKVYTMMMGEIGDETRYSTNTTAQILFIGYAFLVVILLSNVLIAIVTDSYEIIQNDRAAIVFWSNRLDFVAEMDAITYSIQRRLRSFGGHGNDDGQLPLGLERSHSSSGGAQEGPGPMMPKNQGADRSTEYFREGWHQVMLLFDANLYDDVDWIETWVYNIFRIFCVFIVIPLWLALGFVTAGWLWPPQVREYLFVQRETATSRSELERQKLEQLKAIQNELKAMKQAIMREMGGDRDEMVRMKAEVDTIQGEVLADLMQVKELMSSLAVQ